MNLHEYYLVAGGWFVLIAFLSIFWFFTLRRLSEVLKDRLKSTKSRQMVSSFSGMFLFLFRAEYKETGDERLIGVCRRLRQLLYGYLGGIGAYIVFLVIFRPHI
jgi:hypothetical protein